MKTKPRLLYILHCYYNRGGTEQHTRDLAAGLAEHFDIAIAALEKDQLHIIKDGKTTKVFQVGQVPWPITPYEAPVFTQALAQVVGETEPDLIHIQHFFNWPLSLVDHVRAMGKPVVLSLHDYYAITPYFTMQGARDAQHALSKEFVLAIFKSDISDYLRQRLEILQKSFAQVAHKIVPSTYLQQQLKSALPGNYRVIGHGIRPFTPETKVQSTKLRFGYVGTLLPQKGWQQLAGAFQSVHKKHPECALHFFGGGAPVKSNVPYIQFHGTYEQHDLGRICSLIDVGVIPSVFPETFSLVLSELWHGGVPVAASSLGALGERIQDGVNGRSFNPYSTEETAAALGWFLENTSWRSWKLPQPRLLDEMIKEYCTFYNAILG